ncbi:MAG TPA: hypothetical protein VFQ65_06175, partial [Kofleriaceae bacterium]|nr:hypothetical protein [Kofleriaceae bacterium]
PSVAAVLPSVPKPTAPRLGKSPTPPSGRPTAPMGMARVGTAATIPPIMTGREATLPPPARDTLPGVAGVPADRARTVIDERPPQDRASTVPEDDAIPIAMPRTDTKNGPAVASRLSPRGASPGERLIVPKDEAGLANDLLDEAFDGLSRDAVKTLDGPSGMRPPARPAKLPLPAPIGDSEVVMEAEEPPTLERGPNAGKKARAIGDQSEPEISIERFVELEVEEPMNEPERDEGSAPEIMVLTPGRAITADDTQHVSGSIDTHEESAEPAKKHS